MASWIKIPAYSSWAGMGIGITCRSAKPKATYTIAISPSPAPPGSIAGQCEGAPPQGSTGLGKTTGNVYLRQGPGTSHEALDILRKGTEVILYEMESGWYKVKLEDGTAGYVSSKYITVTQSYNDAWRICSSPTSFQAPKHRQRRHHHRRKLPGGPFHQPQKAGPHPGRGILDPLRPGRGLAASRI